VTYSLQPDQNQLEPSRQPTMRIRREQSGLNFRRRQRRSGCLPFVLLLGLLVGILSLSRDWFSQWLNGIDPNQTSSDLQRAGQSFDNGELDAAVAQARALLEQEPDNPGAIMLLARSWVYRSYVDYDFEADRLAALELTRQAVGRVINSRNTDLLAAHAFTLQANNRPDEAVRIALEALQRDPQQIIARVALALAYGQQGIFEAAQREADYAVDLAVETRSPYRVDALRAQAIAYSDLGRYNDALNAVNRAIQVNRRLIPLHFERALYAAQIGNNDAATAAYFQVVAFDESNAKTRLRLCELFSSLREMELALRYCDEAVALAPSWSMAWYQLGREYFLQGQYDSAQEALNRCTSLQVMQEVPIEERRFECWYLQGQAAEVRGDCPALLAVYSEFREMAVRADLPQTWTYPPEGPPGCSLSTPDG